MRVGRDPAKMSLRQWVRLLVLREWVEIVVWLLGLAACGIPLALLFGYFTDFRDGRAIVLGEIAGMVVIGWTVFAVLANESYTDAVTGFLDQCRRPGYWRKNLRRLGASGVDLDAPLGRLLRPGQIFFLERRGGSSYYRIRSYQAREIEFDQISYYSNESVHIEERISSSIDLFLYNDFLQVVGGPFEGRWPPHPLAGKRVRRRTPEKWPGSYLDSELDAAQIAELDAVY